MSSNEATKNQPTQQPYPPTYPPFSAGYPPPPPGQYPPPYFAFGPPPDGAHGENGGQAGPHYHPMMAYAPPPGLVYAYPPPHQAYYQGEANGKQNKRKQVKMACTNCAAACKRCDEARPCERCIKYGLADQCQDGTRKERKKGIKRGPYKRKNKAGGPAEGPSFGAFPQQGNGESATAEWQATPQPVASVGATSTATTSAAIHAVPQYGPPPTGSEAYYPYYYPPHGFMAPPPQPGQDGHGEGPSSQPGQPAVVQYFSVHPGGFPPGGYPTFPHYSPYPPHHVPPQQQQQTMDPKKANVAHRQESEEAEEEEEAESTPIPQPMIIPVAPPVPTPTRTPAAQKKRGRASKAGSEPKAKKPKTSKKAKAAAIAKANRAQESDHSDPVVSSVS